MNVKENWKRCKEAWARLQDKVVNGRRPQPLAVDEAECHVCKNCGTEYRGNYCPGCGQTCKTKRLTARSAVEHLLSIFTSADRGFVHTCADLVVRPGHMMRDYIGGRRVQYISPLNLLFLLSTIYVVMHVLVFQNVDQLGAINEADLNLDNVEVNGMQVESFKATIMFLIECFRKIYENRALLALFFCVSAAVPFWLVFRKTKPKGERVSSWEFFYISCYIACQQLMWTIVCLPWDRMMGNKSEGSLMVLFLITTWDMYQYFQLSRGKTIRRCMVAFALSMLMAVVLFIVLSAMIVAGWLTWEEIKN